MCVGVFRASQGCHRGHSHGTGLSALQHPHRPATACTPRPGGRGRRRYTRSTGAQQQVNQERCSQRIVSVWGVYLPELYRCLHLHLSACMTFSPVSPAGHAGTGHDGVVRNH
ncbi:uncharacterized protein LOC123498695 [Portunus trituberculatus]|uniref:uncharacterized protein LOC123498695 n=1 Tax=Portunus trituberculatus TaxID=210409 RepID=UPI001E1CE3F2|nr:uncharacterized protein LOC123498695 [Portunus trituberculatus]XP_045101996.1 uncharacterized protein LOC123498695 [Portunus trituberculatus]